MKRYLAFGCEQHYPHGGWGDLIGDFDTVEECIAACEEKVNNGDTVGSHVVDMTVGVKILDWHAGQKPHPPGEYDRAGGWKTAAW